jgi:hypothetical protein
VPQPDAAQADRSGPSLRLVLGGVVILSLVLGIAAYWRFTVSERHFAEVQRYMDRVGPERDVEGCVTEVLQWHGTCEANKALCDDGVPRVMTHCLLGRDRSETCSSLDLSSAKAQWVMQKCAERGTPCATRKKCACADAYRALDSFCRHRQQGVAL